jgi:CubicO group peptidase (beta-lactamase class C family)
MAATLQRPLRRPGVPVGNTGPVHVDSATAAAIAELVDRFGRDHHCPSIAWGVIGDGELVAHGGVGDAGGAAPTEHTVYRIASMTKSFSAAVALLLRDEGALRLDDPIGAHAPELADLRSPTADAPAITIRDLLCMSSGLVGDDAWADRHLDLTDDEFDRIVAGGLVFAEPTGACHEYSNFGFAVLGRVIHRATGTRLRDHVTDRLLTPLGMRATTWDQPDHDGWARPMRWLDDAHVDELPTPPDGMIAPMGGIWTTVADLAIWATWLADAFPARDGADDGPVRRSSRREMQTPQRYVGTRTIRDVEFPTSYGYGLRIFDEPRLGTVISHSGGLPGYGSNMRWTPGGSVGVVTLANVTYAPMTELGARVHDLLHERGAVAPAERPSVDEVVRLGVALVAVVQAWSEGAHVSDADLGAVFADNVDDDEAYDRRAAAVARLGRLEIGPVRSTSGGAGCADAVTVDGRRVTITFDLAPPRPPRVQELSVELTPAAT